LQINLKNKLKAEIKLDIGNHSDVGKVREVNEDYFGSFHGSYGDLLIVCDGMGGHKGGEIASRLSVETIKSHFELLSDEYNPRKELLAALQKANTTLLESAKVDSSLADMGSTAVITLFINRRIFTANLGDSRIYLIRGNEINQLTKDHSLVQQMIDSHLITEEDAKTHPKKNVITKSLGIQNEAEPDLGEPITVSENDIFILCTDGLTSYVNDGEIMSTAVEYPSQEASNKLVELANEHGGGDNITVLIARVSSLHK
jgi:protein phosphatase